MSETLGRVDVLQRKVSMATLCEDVAFVLNSSLHFSSKHALLAHAAWKWSERDGKYAGCRWWSNRALASSGIAARRRKLIMHEHAVPKRLIIEKLFDIERPDAIAVRDVLERYCYGAVIARAEDRLLVEAGLSSRMPENWDGANVWARYEAVGIDIVDTATVRAISHCHSYNE